MRTRPRPPPLPASPEPPQRSASERRQAWIARDLAWTLRLHHATRHPALLLLLLAISRLGDGVLWYAAIAVLPWLGGTGGTMCAGTMIGLGLLNLTIYKVVKRLTARPRPYKACASFRECARALDEFSFPSGHTMHAVAFSTVLVGHYPALAWPVWTFTALVALSRVALGLHYPSDVVSGAAIGGLTAGLLMQLT